MRFDIDRYREILDTLTRNKSRSFLTGFGVFWGVFMLVSLLGGGQGLKELLQKNFEGFATNSAIIWAQPTTKPYAGFRKGRQWSMVYKDVERLKQQVPELEVVSPVLSHWGGSATFSDKKSSCSMKGLLPNYQEVEAPKMYYGRYLNDMDIKQNRKVCVIGKKVYKDLFPGGGDPCGKMICVDKIYYDVVGVDYSSGNMNINGRTEESVVVPLTLMQKAYNLGDSYGYLNHSFQNAVFEGIRMSCQSGLHGWEVTDLKVTFTQAEYYSPVSTPADFRQLTPYVFRLALQQSGVDILEPMLCFELQIPQVASSKAITDLQKLMSEIEDISCNNEWCHIKGKVPLNTSKDYASEVSSYTKGLGIFMVKPCGYQITKDGYSDNIRMNEKDKLLFMFQKSMSLK